MEWLIVFLMLALAAVLVPVLALVMLSLQTAINTQSMLTNAAAAALVLPVVLLRLLPRTNSFLNKKETPARFILTGVKIRLISLLFF